MQKPCIATPFSSYQETVPSLLQAVGAPGLLSRQSCILIKPNLVNASPPPVTLPVAACEALVAACRRWSKARIVIAEGSGDRDLSTGEIFQRLGYERLARRYDVDLVDLNNAELVELQNPLCEVFPTFMMPRMVMDSFVISAAVLKAHSLAEVTLSMKNMIGVAPPAYYQQGGHWKKSAFHAQMHRSIFELNRYRKPDLAFIDASVGLAEYHLGGPTCEPPVDKLLAGFDPVAVDAAGSELLGIPWQQVEHIRLADGLLGRAGK
ncbi:protein of unknown function DUF362 [Syntrophotalea carbinolica DSM 2380]|uniref:DUF362 domain-containing protein n=1 Tax=Syntrophotalea carbinolica (strain DSM 2380 / NBRC 103641 / GraBd1) TaxID=338963 RepID=Q3A1K2_SYNC1|nr:DUF362 domain-containing protein [Syntrophotalea carbinolica]ABA89755.1 protein of unknown function DUF362 [Syntrophotalea carbinolica DSM 2380]